MKINKELLDSAENVDLFAALSGDEKAIDRFLVEVATAIINKRKEMGYTQAEFAEYMGVGQSLVSKWENYSKNFSLSSLIPVLEKLDLELKVGTKQPAYAYVTAPKYQEMYSPKTSGTLVAVFSGGINYGTEILQSV